MKVRVGDLITTLYHIPETLTGLTGKKLTEVREMKRHSLFHLQVMADMFLPDIPVLKEIPLSMP